MAPTMALQLGRSVFAQKVLLNSIIKEYEKERIVAMLEKEAAKPQNGNIKLKIDDNIIIFGGIKFIFENGKIKHVE